VQKHLPGILERPHITLRLEEPPPGEEAQIDYGYLGLWTDPVSGRKCGLWAFAMVLSCSRHMFVRAVQHLDQRAWLESHVAGFEFLGGAPSRLVADNLKPGVLKPDLYAWICQHFHKQKAPMGKLQCTVSQRSLGLNGRTYPKILESVVMKQAMVRKAT
jgi:hypothetical protein